MSNTDYPEAIDYPSPPPEGFLTPVCRSHGLTLGRFGGGYMIICDDTDLVWLTSPDLDFADAYYRNMLRYGDARAPAASQAQGRPELRAGDNT